MAGFICLNDGCAMCRLQGIKRESTHLCEVCERLVCDLHAANTYGSFAYCMFCFARAVAAGAILPEIYDYETRYSTAEREA